ncbi:hypothetical protein YC2023_121524 [Brassica napus]
MANQVSPGSKSINGAVTANGRNSKDENSGFSFVNCSIGGTGHVWLGRAWRPYSRVIFVSTFMTDVIAPEGWNNFNDPSRDATIFYGEYNCSGPGANISKRAQYVQKLNETQVAQFINMTIIDGDQWLQSLFLSYVSIEIILSEKQTQTFIPMEPTGNSADSSDRKTGKKIVASSATVKPNGKSIASSAIVKTDVSSTVPLLFSSIPESFSPLNSVPEIKCRRGKKAFLLHGISPESINLFLLYCNEDSKMIDVYEYREKGTLKDHRNDSDNPRLSWRQKLEICAKGLHYLHTGSARATIHFV